MRSGNEDAGGFLLACFNHSVADTVSANHSPLIQLVTYNWRLLGLSGSVDDDERALRLRVRVEGICRMILGTAWA